LCGESYIPEVDRYKEGFKKGSKLLTRMRDHDDHGSLVIPNGQEHISVAAGRGHPLLLEVKSHLTLTAGEEVAGVFKQVKADLKQGSTRRGEGARCQKEKAHVTLAAGQEVAGVLEEVETNLHYRKGGGRIIREEMDRTVLCLAACYLDGASDRLHGSLFAVAHPVSPAPLLPAPPARPSVRHYSKVASPRLH
jgi:hypothetical protein